MKKVFLPAFLVFFFLFIDNSLALDAEEPLVGTNQCCEHKGVVPSGAKLFQIKDGQITSYGLARVTAEFNILKEMPNKTVFNKDGTIYLKNVDVLVIKTFEANCQPYSDGIQFVLKESVVIYN